MAASEQVLSGILSRSAQIPDGFFFGSRRVNFGQQAGSQQLRELSRVPPIRLDVIAGLDRDQRGGDDLAVDPRLLELPLERVAAGSGLVTSLDLACPFSQKPFPKPPYSGGLVLDFPFNGDATARRQQGDLD